MINGKRRRVAVSELGESAQAGIEAAWSGEETHEGTLAITPHPVAIRYGALVRLVASDLLDAAELGALDAQVASALGCKSIVAAVIGGSAGLKISVLGWNHTISAAALETACAVVVSTLEKRALGRFELDGRVEVGGGVTWSSVPQRGSIKLQSGPAFGGVVRIAPKAFAPRVGVSFTADRVEAL